MFWSLCIIHCNLRLTPEIKGRCLDKIGIFESKLKISVVIRYPNVSVSMVHVRKLVVLSALLSITFI